MFIENDADDDDLLMDRMRETCHATKLDSDEEPQESDDDSEPDEETEGDDQ